MKRLFPFLIAVILCVGMLAGCSQNGENKSEEIIVYSFCGENEQFTVSADEEVFCGGDLSVIDQDQF